MTITLPSPSSAIYLYADPEKKQGWYLFFDGQHHLASLEAVGMDRLAADAG